MHHELRMGRENKYSRFHTKSTKIMDRNKPCADFTTRNYQSIGKYTGRKEGLCEYLMSTV